MRLVRLLTACDRALPELEDDDLARMIRELRDALERRLSEGGVAIMASARPRRAR
ncbi:MAG TPA: hypothetical protein VKB10_00275 [Gaiellaceae bacterium]|nr:hypothetical protein [Gaiellaceae bacterium]